MHLFKNHCFPDEIIQYAVWLYFVFPLNFRDVELFLYQRGIRVGHEAILIVSDALCWAIIAFGATSLT